MAAAASIPNEGDADAETPMSQLLRALVAVCEQPQTYNMEPVYIAVREGMACCADMAERETFLRQLSRLQMAGERVYQIGQDSFNALRNA